MNAIRIATLTLLLSLLASAAQAQWMLATAPPHPVPVNPIFVEEGSQAEGAHPEYAQAMSFPHGEEPPIPINLKGVSNHIQYPAYAIQHQIEGTVQLRVLVDEEGGYVKHLVLRSPHRVLTEAVEAELDRISFLPALRHDKPIRGWVTVPFAFELKAKD